MRRAISFSLLLITTWAAANAPVKQGWQCVGNQDLAQAVEVLIGPNAVDCGFFQMGKKLDVAVQRHAFDCVRKALRGNKPFKFGTVRIPVDSVITEVLARSVDGKLWFIVFDNMFDEGATQWNATCEAASVDRKTLYVDGEHCKEYSGGALVPP